MGASDRTVSHLRLRAPSAQAATHAAHRLEDALRCASLPDTGERVLLVRRLHLGRLPVGLSSQSLSLLIEQRVAAVGGEWVHGGDEARAARSDTVFFANRLQAAQAALQRRAMGLPLDGWHWALALPGMALRAPPGEFIAQLLDAVSRWPEAVAALPALVGSVQASIAQAWWREHLPPAWRERLAPLLARGDMHAQTGVRMPATAQPQPRAAAHAPLQSNDPVTGRAEVRDAHRDGPAKRWPEPPGGSPHSPAVIDTPDSKTSQVAHPLTLEPMALHGLPEPSIQPWVQASKGPPSREQAEADPGPFETVRVHVDVGASSVASPFEAFATQAGGLLFLWPVLDRLGFAAWDAAHPDAWLVPRVLRLALQRLRVPDDDPAWGLLASLPGMQVSARASEDMAEKGLHACRHHARRVLRIGLASLVLRPAGLHWSATHIDVHFRLRDADIRVRRAALDIDPGWVGGLQRVVGFHYDREEFHP